MRVCRTCRVVSSGVVMKGAVPSEKSREAQGSSPPSREPTRTKDASHRNCIRAAATEWYVSWSGTLGVQPRVCVLVLCVSLCSVLLSSGSRHAAQARRWASRRFMLVQIEQWTVYTLKAQPTDLVLSNARAAGGADNHRDSL